jgi:hypothetical protein
MRLLYDSRSVSEILDCLPVQEAEDMLREFKALAVIGTLAIKSRLADIVLDDKESDGLRSELIPSIDWSNHIDDLIGLIRTSDSELVHQAAIAAALQIPDNESYRIETALIGRFLSTANDQDRLAIINYFINRNPGQIQYLIDRSPIGSLSEVVNEQLNLALPTN